MGRKGSQAKNLYRILWFGISYFNVKLNIPLKIKYGINYRFKYTRILFSVYLCYTAPVGIQLAEHTGKNEI